MSRPAGMSWADYHDARAWIADGPPCPRAVLEAIREPSVEMYRAGVDAALGSLPEKTFRAMIAALIAEVGK